MSWEEFLAARQLLTEEHIGVPLRQMQRAEMEQVEATKAAIRKAM